MFELIVGIFLIVCFFGTGFLIGWSARRDIPSVNSYDMVTEFHEAFGHPAPKTPIIIEDGRAELRIALIAEELDELREAVAANDLVAIADALGDLDYVVNGAAIEYGIPLPSITAEIHRSNMTKLGEDGRPIYREDGKILKGPDYSPPNLEPVLARA